MLKEKILFSLEDHEISALIPLIFQDDFLKFIFGHPFDPVQLIEEYFYSLIDKNFPPKNLIFKILTKEEKIAGFVWFENISWIHRNLVMTIYLFPEFRLKGIGAKALYHSAYYVFKVMNFKKIKSFIYFYNDEMKKIFEIIGCKPEGIVKGFRIYQGKFIDALIYSLKLEDFLTSEKIKLGRKRWEINF